MNFSQAFAGAESETRALVKAAIAESQPAAIEVDILTHWSPTDGEQLYPTMFHPIGVSLGIRAIDAAHAERLAAKMRKDPEGMMAKFLCSPVRAAKEGGYDG